MEKEKIIDEILFRIVKLNHEKMLKSMGEMEIYPGQPKLLQSLIKQDGISQKELAKDIYITPATVTIMLKKLEEEELIIRETDEKDQRIVRIYLTETGKEQAKKIQKIKNKIIEDILKGFTEEEIKVLKTLLLKIEQNLI